MEASALVVQTIFRRTLNLFASARGASQQQGAALGRYEIGGFHQLSGYRDGQLLGNYVLFLRLSWFVGLSDAPFLTRSFVVGATVEAGNCYASRDALRAESLRAGISVFVGADTGLGPLYLGLTHAPRGRTGVVLFICRP